MNGYHFKYRVRHLGLDTPDPGISILVIARNAADAYVAAGKAMPIEGIRLLEHGPAVLALARQHGVLEGEGLVLRMTVDASQAA